MASEHATGQVADKPCAKRRSDVPDLLFDDIRDERLADIHPFLEVPERAAADIPLHRVTVFLTYKCNLSCPYCKTIARTAADLAAFPQKAETFDLPAFRALLDSYAGRDIRHLHFTGGEPTVVVDLPAMVALARQHGIPHLSITSNGTRDARTYVALVNSGIGEIRISIDARDPVIGARLTGRPLAWHASVEHLRSVVALRQPPRRFSVIANTVVSAINRHDTAEIVSFLISLGVDDIKLITAVDERDTLGQFPEVDSIVHAIDEVLSAHHPDAFPLLRRKLRTVFASDSIGLDTVRTTDGENWRCYIPLSERTVDAMYYYPCSVYLREGGRPLGRISDSAERQWMNTANFVRHGRCLDDPICRTYCLHCTKAFNVAANEARDRS